MARGTLCIFSCKSATKDEYPHSTGDALPEICLTVTKDDKYILEADDWSNPFCLRLDVPAKLVKCMTFVGRDHLWCGCGNGIAVVDIVNMKVIKQIPVFFKTTKLVRELVSDGNAVWGVGRHLSCVLQWDVKTYTLVSVFDCSNVDPTGLTVNTSPTELDDLFSGSNDEVQISDHEVEMSNMFERSNELDDTSELTWHRPASLHGPNASRRSQQEKRDSLRQTSTASSHQCSTQTTSLAIHDRTLWIGRAMGDVIILDISQGPTHGKVLARLATEDCEKYGLKSYHKLVAIEGKYVVSSQWLEKLSFQRGEDSESSGEAARAHNRIIVWDAWNHTHIQNVAAQSP